MIDLTPATDELSRLVRAVDDDALSAATPSEGVTVADLLDHIGGLAGAFTSAARKDTASSAPSADGARLSADWRERIPERLAELARAWAKADAWQGTTEAGGLAMPGEVAAAVAADELVAHGWDLATATGRYFAADPDVIELALTFVRPSVAQGPAGTPGLFGPPVPVADDAPSLFRLLGLTGRDPGPVPEAIERTGKGTGGQSAAGSSEPVSWRVATGKLDGGWFYWLATVRPDGRPHVMPVFAAWWSPVFYVASKSSARKSRNLARDGRCTLTRDLGDLHLVIEGDARRVTDPDGLDRASTAFNTICSWPTTVVGDELDAPFGAPTSGGPPYQAWAITPVTAFSFPTDGESTTPTRWRFG